MSEAKRDDGGPAFPHQDGAVSTSNGFAVALIQPGMSLRDWFAGQALAGMIRNSDPEIARDPHNARLALACKAYWMADAMLEARKR